MADLDPVEATNLDIYGASELPWSEARDRLAQDLAKADTPMFLGTVRPDGTPHAAGVGASWYDGDVYIVSGPGTQKSRNLAANPACTLSVRATGMDLVLDGRASRVTDPETLQRLAEIYQAGGWPCEVEGDAFTAPYSAPSAGRPPWYVYRMVIDKVVGLGTLGSTAFAMRWRFER